MNDKELRQLIRLLGKLDYRQLAVIASNCLHRMVEKRKP